MSTTARLFVVVEGTETDRWYYDALCRQSPVAKKAKWLVWPAEQFTRHLPNATRKGKNAVIELYEQAKSGRYLTVSIGKKSCSLLFCVDSDLDRFTGGKRRSPHLFYTELPDVEAEVIRNCNFPKVMSTLTSIPMDEAKNFHKSLGDVPGKLGAAYIEIVALYCTAKKINATYVPTLPKPEDAKTFPPARVSPAQIGAELAKIKLATSVADHEVTAVYNKTASQLARLVINGRARYFLKGKWIRDYLFFRINDELQLNGRSGIKGKDAVGAVLRACCEPRGAAARNFIERLAVVIQ